MIHHTEIKKRGPREGRTVAVFAGIHGDEKAGVEAMDKVINECSIDTGMVYFVFGNPEAIKKAIAQYRSRHKK